MEKTVYETVQETVGILFLDIIAENISKSIRRGWEKSEVGVMQTYKGVSEPTANIFIRTANSVKCLY